jgi:S-DNA-T family DNA segregation ATPase FtsK/SpoIIIE
VTAAEIVSRGQSAIESGDYEAAEAAYREADAMQDAEAAFLLGDLLRGKGDLSGAEDAYRRAEARGHSNAPNRLGFMLEDRGDTEGAKAAYGRAIAAGSDYGELHLGYLLAQEGHAERALSYLRIAEQKGDPEASLAIGNILAGTDDLEGAAEAYRTSADRGHYVGAHELGTVLRKLGDIDGARAAFRRSVDLGGEAAQRELDAMDAHVTGLDAPLSEQSTLASAIPTIVETDRGVWQFFADLYDALEKAVAAAIREEPDLSQLMGRAAALVSSIKELYAHKWGWAAGGEARPGSDSGKSLDEWIRAATLLQDEMDAARVPIRSSKQVEQRLFFSARINALLGALPMVERMTLNLIFRSYPASAQHAAEGALAELTPDLNAKMAVIAPVPPVLGSLSAGAMDPGPVAGLGILAFSIGSAAVGPLTIQLQAPGRPGLEEPTQSTQIPLPRFAVPIFTDLDRHGGLVTDSKTTVENVILKLLALLPPGQLKADIFDPLHLGESASVLFGLGESATQVIGEKVLTTEKDLENVLLELEEHITFVTQKYLGSNYESLTAYNQAAGEVAEPYRLLVLYDYPAGFVRKTSQVNDEALERLARIVKSGPRCGVFTLILLSNENGRPLDEAVHPLTGLRPYLAGKRVPNMQSILSRGDDSEGVSSMIFDPREIRARDDRSTGNAQRQQTAFVAGAEAVLLFRPDEPAADDVVKAIFGQLERGLARAGDVRVNPQDVARLADARHERDVRVGITGREVMAQPHDPSTWWFGDATQAISANFGRLGASDVASLTFDSQTLSGALIGGRPGSGKSVLLHAILAALCMRYSPEELQLYLVDFKEGVEFKAYAAGGLPHARVVAIEAEREFGISVLEALDAEITRRGALFRSGSGEDIGLIAYRQRSGEKLSRQLLVIDEFHVLFERDDTIATRAAELLDRIVRQGRAFGVHSILASQTLAGMSGLGKHTLNQIPVRIALQCSDADSRMLLGDENPDAQLLTKPGEGILNASNGLRAANQRFQATFWSAEERAALVGQLAARCEPLGSRHPVVFEGRQPAEVSAVPPEVFQFAEALTLRLPLGMPLTLDPPVIAQLRREPGSNFLIVGEDELGVATLIVGLPALALQGATVHVCDFGPLDGPFTQTVEFLARRQLIKSARSRQAQEVIAALAEEVKTRLSLNDYKAPSTVLVLPWIHRARDLDPDFGGDMIDNFELVLKDGPDVGVHIVAWCDRAASLTRRLTPLAQREFSLRLLGSMSRDDSDRLIDSTAAAAIDPSQAVFDDHDRTTTVRLRRFVIPNPEWVESIAGKA